MDAPNKWILEIRTFGETDYCTPYVINEPIIHEILLLHCCPDSYLFLDSFEYSYRLGSYSNNAVHKAYCNKGFSFIKGVSTDGISDLILYYQCVPKSNIDEFLKVEKELYAMYHRAGFIKGYSTRKGNRKKFILSPSKRRTAKAIADFKDDYYHAICNKNWYDEMAKKVQEKRELQYHC